MPRPELKLAVFIACSKGKQESAGLLPARERYRGRGFRRAIVGIDAYRARGGAADLFIVSGHFGLVGEFQPLPWYEGPIPGQRGGLERWRTKVDLQRSLADALSAHDAAIVALPAAYLAAVAGPAWEGPARLLVIAAKAPRWPGDWLFTEADRAEASRLGVTLREVGAATLARVLADEHLGGLMKS
jgi:hypothetical protein